MFLCRSSCSSVSLFLYESVRGSVYSFDCLLLLSHSAFFNYILFCSVPSRPISSRSVPSRNVPFCCMLFHFVTSCPRRIVFCFVSPVCSLSFCSLLFSSFLFSSFHFSSLLFCSTLLRSAPFRSSPFRSALLRSALIRSYCFVQIPTVESADSINKLCEALSLKFVRYGPSGDPTVSRFSGDFSLILHEPWFKAM